jgi:hypothetical protein
MKTSVLLDIAEHHAGSQSQAIEVFQALDKAGYYITKRPRPIEEAPKCGKPFWVLIDRLPYLAKYGEHGRFVWCMHGNIATGASYNVKNIDGKRLLEETKAAEYDYQRQWYLWRLGFEHKPTHFYDIDALPKPESATMCFIDECAEIPPETFEKLKTMQLKKD